MNIQPAMQFMQNIFAIYSFCTAEQQFFLLGFLIYLNFILLLCPE